MKFNGRRAFIERAVRFRTPHSKILPYAAFDECGQTASRND